MNIFRFSLVCLFFSCANYDGSFSYSALGTTSNINTIKNFTLFISEALLRAKFKYEWHNDKLNCDNVDGSLGFIKKNYLGETYTDGNNIEKIKLSFDNCSLNKIADSSVHNSIKLNGYLIYDSIKHLESYNQEFELSFLIKEAELAFKLPGDSSYKCNIKNLNTTASFSFSNENNFNNINIYSITYTAFNNNVAVLCYKNYNTDNLNFLNN